LRFKKFEEKLKMLNFIPLPPINIV
jgi:hypothetical protein